MIQKALSLLASKASIVVTYHSISGTILAGIFHHFDKNHASKFLQKRFFTNLGAES